MRTCSQSRFLEPKAKLLRCLGGQAFHRELAAEHHLRNVEHTFLYKAKHRDHHAFMCNMAIAQTWGTMFNPQNDVIVAVILVALIIDIKNHPLWT
jgi:hypothetical protein